MDESIDQLTGCGFRRFAGQGVFVAVVGPSGAGKDTLIVRAKEQLPAEGFYFPRRLVTRPADAALEDHQSLSEDAFEAARRQGRFALWWQAHGLSYALPGEVSRRLEQGQVVVANISRAALGGAERAFGRILVAHVTAPAAVLAERLSARGRESVEEITARLMRAGDRLPDLTDQRSFLVDIDNGGDLETAVARFAGLLMSLREVSQSG
jgi:ribose 1,5-bisphosphokinase